MARTDNLENFLTDVAKSIKDKKGTTDKISASNFDTEIANLEIGNEPSLTDITISPSVRENVITPGPDYDGFGKITVEPVTHEIDDYIIPENIRAGIPILGITGIFEGGETPTGDITLTENGTYNIAEYAKAHVNVPTGSSVLPERVLSLTSGSFTVDKDVSSDYVVEHDLGQRPNFYLVYTSVIAESVNWAEYLSSQTGLAWNFMTGSIKRRSCYISYMGKSDGTTFTTTSVVSSGAFNSTATTFTMNIKRNRRLRAGTTYHFICGRLRGLEQL